MDSGSVDSLPMYDRRPLTTLETLYAVDCSGSTSGSIMSMQIESASLLSQTIKAHTIVGWDNNDVIVKSFPELSRVGGSLTDPNVIVKHLSKNVQALILYTDGEIGIREMDKFRSNMMNQIDKDMPIIVVFTLSSRFDMDSEIRHISQVNMSIPEGLLSSSSNVLVLFNVQMAHKVLMAKGSFAQTFPTVLLDPSTKISDLPDFEVQRLSLVEMVVLPEGYMQLYGVPELVKVHDLYNHTIDIPENILDALCNRVYFPQLDVDMLYNKLCVMMRARTTNVQLLELNDALAAIAVDPTRAGSAEHRATLALYNEMRKHPSARKSDNILKAVSKLMSLLNAYKKDKTSIAFGSNRATHAKMLDDSESVELTELTECVQVPECPIYLCEGPACILIRNPAHFKSHVSENGQASAKSGLLEERSLVEYATSDKSIDAPFQFGKMLECSMTRGTYCLEFAKQCVMNPYTREPIIGYIVMANDPAVVMKCMSKIFGGSRVMWHFVCGYLSMIAAHCTSREWADEAILREHASILLDNYQCKLTLKSDDSGKCASLRECLKYVCTHYETCLRDRCPSDVRAIIKIISWIMPDYDFSGNYTKIIGMVNCIEIFERLLYAYKNDTLDIISLVMDVDEYGHFKAQRTDIDSLIARIFWGAPQYKSMKLQYAINVALTDPVFGACMQLAFRGEDYVTGNENLFQIAFAEPDADNDHFPKIDKDHFSKIDNNPKKFEVISRDGSWPNNQCVHCGELFPGDQFRGNKDLFDHLRGAWGPHFYNGQKAVKYALAEAMHYDLDGQSGFDNYIGYVGYVGFKISLPSKPTANCPETLSLKSIFKSAKDLLYRWHGVKNGALHTQHCKDILLYFIRGMSRYCNVHDRLVE